MQDIHGKVCKIHFTATKQVILEALRINVEIELWMWFMRFERTGHHLPNSSTFGI